MASDRVFGQAQKNSHLGNAAGFNDGDNDRQFARRQVIRLRQGRGVDRQIKADAPQEQGTGKIIL
jgi:hypothetical protein